MCVFGLGIAVFAGRGSPPVFIPAFAACRRHDSALRAVALVSSPQQAIRLHLPSLNPALHEALDGSRELLTRLRTLTGSVSPPYRIDMADAPYHWSSSAPSSRSQLPMVVDPSAPERMIQVRLSFAPGARWGTCYQVVNTSSPVIGLANVRYVVSRTPVTGGFRLADEVAGYKIYENPRTLPRFFLVQRVRSFTSLADAAKALHADTFAPSQEAIIETPVPGLETSKYKPPSPGHVTVVSYSANAIELTTHASAPSFLVAADIWYPGWQATLDTTPTPLYATDVAFRGIKVPAGEHHVTMRFAPRILYSYGSRLAGRDAGACGRDVQEKVVMRQGVCTLFLAFCAFWYIDVHIRQQLPALGDTPSDFVHYYRAAQKITHFCLFPTGPVLSHGVLPHG